MSTTRHMFDAPVVTPAEIERVFLPHVTEQCAIDSSAYREQLARQVRKLARQSQAQEPVTESNGWRDAEGKRTVASVDAGYERVWAATPLADQLTSERTTWFEWGDRAMVARTIARKHVHQLLFVRTLERLDPESVAEVGFGNGFNLLLLSMQFPGIRFSGVELTSAGVNAARTLGDDTHTEAVLSPFAINPVLRRPTVAPDRLLQGRADALPLESKSVDVVFTSLALEQMEDIRDKALGELARVARRYVVMIEPFRDWNSVGHRRSYIQLHHYFDAAVADLEPLGLRPVLATADFPNKLSFHVGLVVAEVV